VDKSPRNNTSERIDEVERLLNVLPQRLQEAIIDSTDIVSVVEIVLDLGRVPVARVSNKFGIKAAVMGKGNDVKLSKEPVTRAEIQWIVDNCTEFGLDNRSGIDGTLHRISAIRNRAGVPVGITCRVGEAVSGSAEMVRDIVLEGKSVLLLGRPGIGKTTVIREISRMLADDALKRVMIVDTSNEIGGDGDIPHPGVGRARRLQVPTPADQHRVMIEAVENHMPDTIVIDEIGTQEECLAARSIAQRGVQLIATAHGNVLENIMKNPSLSDLVGGISSVTLGDQESRRRGVQKSVLERISPPTFDVVLEMIDRSQWNFHLDVAWAVDEILQGRDPDPEMREMDLQGKARMSRSGAISMRETLIGSKNILFGSKERVASPTTVTSPQGEDATPVLEPKKAVALKKRTNERKGNGEFNGLNFYIEGIEDSILDEITKDFKRDDRIRLSQELDGAHAIFCTRSALKTNASLKEIAKYSRIPLFLVKSGSKNGIKKGMQKLLGQHMLPVRLLQSEGKEAGISSSIKATGGILECKAVVDEIVVKKHTPVELVPKDEETLLRLTAMAEGLGLSCTIVGRHEDGTLRIRVMPKGYSDPSPESMGSISKSCSVEFW